MEVEDVSFSLNGSTELSAVTTILLESSSSPFFIGTSESSVSCSDLFLCLLLFLELVADAGDVSSLSEVDLRDRLDRLGEPLSGEGVFSFIGSGEGDFLDRLASGEASSTITNKMSKSLQNEIHIPYSL